MAASGMLALVPVLQILSLNIWGLPDAGFRVLSPLREERVALICEELKRGSWDVVLLQEAWVTKDRETLRYCGYPHFLDLDDPTLVSDSGLIILSRYPLERGERLQYGNSADPGSVFTDGEAFARKSALVARVNHPDGAFWVGNTHLISFYEQESANDQSTDRYYPARVQQLRNFATWTLAKAHAASEPLIIGGDLNFPRLPSRETRNWINESGLEGVFSFPLMPSRAEENCTICPPNRMHKFNEGRVDYLLAGPGFRALDSSQAMKAEFEPEPGFFFNLSDHYGWQARFQRGL